ncbi:hypothetical protein [Aureibacillus halotolerans]|uniref:Uncharacterized protein n=1 Tax=Aureibacillus halotolerans TaxID=1508390 RepID=A0A4R6TQL0_9BACI|nr:hypothetical protein [Aureibacillus halotolerans]TDQ32139.1 hypothetical protein EV213_1332 [Aureibacillus halotolerans]
MILDEFVKPSPKQRTSLQHVDFYYGALLSFMINKGNQPSLLRDNENRRMYNVQTDEGHYHLYVKYATSPIKPIREAKKQWSFTYSGEEVNEIIKQHKVQPLTFAFVCGFHSKLNESHLAILSYNQLADCLDINYPRKSYYLKTVLIKNSPLLRVHGTGRNDFQDNKDNALKVPKADFSVVEFINN